MKSLLFKVLLKTITSQFWRFYPFFFHVNFLSSKIQVKKLEQSLKTAISSLKVDCHFFSSKLVFNFQLLKCKTKKNLKQFQVWLKMLIPFH